MASSSAAPASPFSRKTPQEVQILQQRLLILNHAMKCTSNPPGDCLASRYCGYVRILWKHMLKCKDQDCKFSQCISSRYVLTHYGNCRDKLCPICPRVKESTKRDRSNEATEGEEAEKGNTSKRPRQAYWWASEQLLQYKQTITIPPNTTSQVIVEGIGRTMSNMSIHSNNPFLSDDSSVATSVRSGSSLNSALSYSSVDSLYPSRQSNASTRGDSPFIKLSLPPESTYVTSATTASITAATPAGIAVCGAISIGNSNNCSTVPGESICSYYIGSHDPRVQQRSSTAGDISHSSPSSVED